MHSHDGRFVLSFNGEIYNHGELRRSLEEAGASPQGGWRGHSDTETLLEAIAAWGLREAVGKAVGMFAFALWDRRERTLRLPATALARSRSITAGWARISSLPPS